MKKLLELEGTSEQRADSIVEDISDTAANVTPERMKRATSASAVKIVEETIEFVDALLTNSTSVSKLYRVDNASRSTVYAANANSHALLLQAPYAGSESVYEEVSMKRDRGLHTGAIMVSYVLVDDGGKVVLSGVESAHGAAATQIGRPQIDWK